MELRCLSSLKWKWVRVHISFKFRMWVRVRGGYPLLRGVGERHGDDPTGLGSRESLSGLTTLNVEHPAVKLLVLRELAGRGSQEMPSLQFCPRTRGRPLEQGRAGLAPWPLASSV